GCRSPTGRPESACARAPSGAEENGEISGPDRFRRGETWITLKTVHHEEWALVGSSARPSEGPVNAVPTSPQTAEQGDRIPRPRTGPLAGVRVADFCWMGVGAVATRMLADFGADVIRIEDRNRLDMPRRLPIYKDGGPR